MLRLASRVNETAAPSGEDVLRITARERTDMKINNQSLPYVRHQVCRLG